MIRRSSISIISPSGGREFIYEANKFTMWSKKDAEEDTEGEGNNQGDNQQRGKDATERQSEEHGEASNVQD